MPNWCENTLELSGDPGQVEACFEQLTEDRGDGTRRVTFDKILPMPKVLEHLLHRDPRRFGEEDGGYFKLDPEALRTGRIKAARRLTDAEIKEVEKLGVSNECDWARAHWGCKWDASESSASLDSDEGLASLRFHTPWCPPEGVFKEVCRRFPGIHPRLAYHDDGLESHGRMRREDFEPAAAGAPGP